MADTYSNSLKRAHPDDVLQSGDAQKKIRSNNGSPAPLSSKPDVSKIMEDARARAAAAAARLQGSGPRTNGTSTPQSAGAIPSGGASTMSRLEQMKARVAATMAKTSGISEQRTASPLYQTPVLDDGLSGARGGLATALHPALMENAGQSAGSSRGKQAIQAKFPTTMANRRPASPANQTTKPGKGKRQLDLSGPSAEETRSNPYFDASLGAQTATLKARNRRELAFNIKGKYIQQALALRKQAQLEATKRKIAESIKRAGLQDDPTEKNFLISAPPAVEWWDENLVSGDYSGKFLVDSEDSIVTRYVQHPVLLEPNQSRLAYTPKPLPLTKKEAAKVRRVRRMQDLKEVQSKMRLGLIPVPEPKVKLKNMMRVLGEEAVKDPTAVEARVNRQIAERVQTHEKMNEDRKLTKEEKNEKLEQKKAADEAKGVFLSVYKIDSLVNGRHRFKIGKNAEQMGGRGLCLMSPRFNLVLFESGEHSQRAYEKLMLNRIDWQENSPAYVREGNRNAQTASFLNPEDDAGNLRDLSFNRCELIFSGQQKEHQFRKPGLQSRVCETDKEAIEALERAKLGSMWTLAKSVN